MNKSQAINTFWNSFGLHAYDENSVPDDAVFPYITYSQATDSLGNVVLLNASIWDRSSSWITVSQIADEIAQTLAEYGYYKIKLDNGYLWMFKGTPFAQRMSDPIDREIKRIYLNVNAEYLTAY